ncbi:hypothetical protein Bbelb_264630 [Branchiostoma belcheri]|nr:hypothetical protein Bbelb_264630 [Branchiostoma belcheri]
MAHDSRQSSWRVIILPAIDLPPARWRMYGMTVRLSLSAGTRVGRKRHNSLRPWVIMCAQTPRRLSRPTPARTIYVYISAARQNRALEPPVRTVICTLTGIFKERRDLRQPWDRGRPGGIR